MKRTLCTSTVSRKQARLGEKKPYYLFVDDVLVKVGTQEEDNGEIDEIPLLRTVEQLSWGTLDDNGHIQVVPPTLLRDIAAKNQGVLIDLINSGSTTRKVLVGKKLYSIFDLLVLGGWRYSCDLYLSCFAENCTPNLALAAFGGHTNMIESALQNLSTRQARRLILAAEPVAKHFGHSKFLHELSTHKRRLFHLEPQIPSLLSVCTHVIAAEVSRHIPLYATKLLSLPASLIGLVALQIAKDQAKGYCNLKQLSVSNPCLGKLIPLKAWIFAHQSAEDKTRYFTQNLYDLDEDLECPPIINVFEEISTFVIASYDEEFENSVTKLLEQPRKIGEPSIVNREQFLLQFNTFTNGIFTEFDFRNIVVIGGSVIGSLLPLPEDKTEMGNYYSQLSPFKSSDIDLCIYELSEIDFKKQVKYIYQYMERKVKEAYLETNKERQQRVRIYESSTSVVFVALFPFRNVQVTLTRFRNIWQIFTGVDIDCCAFAFDGKTLWASPRARMAVNYRWTIVDPDLYKIRGCPDYELRLIKYANRGFTIVDRYLHVFEEMEEEPRVRARDFSSYGESPLSGAALVSAIVKWHRVAQVMDTVASKGALPYGSEVGFYEIEEFLAKKEARTGYGPSDTRLKARNPNQLLERKLIMEEKQGYVDFIHPWYSCLLEKQ